MSAADQDPEVLAEILGTLKRFPLTIPRYCAHCREKLPGSAEVATRLANTAASILRYPARAEDVAQVLTEVVGWLDGWCVKCHEKGSADIAAVSGVKS